MLGEVSVALDIDQRGSSRAKQQSVIRASVPQSPRLRQCTGSVYGQDVAERVRRNPTPTPQHTVRIDDELWDAAQRIAARRRETVSDVVRHALVEYVDKHQRPASED